LFVCACAIVSLTFLGAMLTFPKIAQENTQTIDASSSGAEAGNKWIEITSGSHTIIAAYHEHDTWGKDENMTLKAKFESDLYDQILKVEVYAKAYSDNDCAVVALGQIRVTAVSGVTNIAIKTRKDGGDFSFHDGLVDDKLTKDSNNVFTSKDFKVHSPDFSDSSKHSYMIINIAVTTTNKWQIEAPNANSNPWGISDIKYEGATTGTYVTTQNMSFDFGPADKLQEIGNALCAFNEKKEMVTAGATLVKSGKAYYYRFTPDDKKDWKGLITIRFVPVVQY